MENFFFLFQLPISTERDIHHMASLFTACAGASDPTEIGEDHFHHLDLLVYISHCSYVQHSD